MRHGWPPRRRSGVWSLVFLLSTGGSGLAAPIFKGTGALAWVDTLDQYAQQSGSTPALVSATETVHYTHFGNLAPDQAPVTVNAFASSTPTAGAADLLDIRSQANSPVSSDVVGASRPWPVVETQANWGNVQATVQGPPGASLPQSIRLEFRVEYTGPGQMPSNYISPYGSDVRINPGPAVFLGPAGMPAQIGEAPVQALPNGMLGGTFHLDLPLSDAGVSKLFNVSVSSMYSALPLDLLLAQGNEVRVALADVVLPDGTSLEQKGYKVTFESGLPDPPPVPEPSAWAAWGLLAACGWAAVRRRRAG